MTTNKNDQYWLDLITQCRTSGKTDRQWCLENGIAASTFYYHVKVLRNKACSVPEAVTPITSPCQQVVPVDFTEEPISGQPQKELPAVRVTMHGTTVEISNHADRAVIANTLLALNQLC